MPLTIIGAGMAGLLAANMLRHRQPTVMEQQSALPNNHSAVLRFESSIIGDILNIPFRRVQMIKDTLRWRNPVADALAYAYKGGGVYRSDRSINDGFKAQDRFIAPPDLIKQMARTVEILYDTRADARTPPTISTIPMPTLMRLLDYPDIPRFDYVEGCNVRARVSCCEAYVSLYIPNPDLPFSRISITGDELIIECSRMPVGTITEQSIAYSAANVLGIDIECIDDIRLIPQQYAKIQPIDHDARKRFIWWATDQHGVYSLGRYATWRPGLKLDELVNDIRLIDRWLVIEDKYSLSKHRQSRGAN